VSGGPTQAAAPHLTEARGAQALFRDLKIRIPLAGERIIVEPHALDSVENVILSLMTVRDAFPNAAFGRIVIRPAWAFKKPRFTALAAALGIGEQCYVCGGAQPAAANDGRHAETGERTQLDRMKLENDPLLMADDWERKRATRYQGDGYASRVDRFRRRFPRCFSVLDRMRASGTSGALLTDFQLALRAEVITPSVPSRGRARVDRRRSAS
jgi:hypothetical protein